MRTLPPAAKVKTGCKNIAVGYILPYIYRKCNDTVCAYSSPTRPVLLACTVSVCYAENY